MLTPTSKGYGSGRRNSPLKARKSPIGKIRSPRAITHPEEEYKKENHWLYPMLEKGKANPYVIGEYGQLVVDIVPKDMPKRKKEARLQKCGLLDAPGDMDYTHSPLDWSKSQVILGLDKCVYIATMNSMGKVVGRDTTIINVGNPIVSVSQIGDQRCMVRCRNGKTTIVHAGRVVDSFSSGSRCMWGHASDVMAWDRSVIVRDFDRPFMIKDLRGCSTTFMNGFSMDETTTIRSDGGYCFAAGFDNGKLAVYDVRQTRSPTFEVDIDRRHDTMVRDVVWHNGVLTAVSNAEEGGKLTTVHASLGKIMASRSFEGEYFVGVHSTPLNDIMTSSNIGPKLLRRDGCAYTTLARGFSDDKDPLLAHTISSSYNADADKMLILENECIAVWNMQCAGADCRRRRQEEDRRKLRLSVIR